MVALTALELGGHTKCNVRRGVNSALRVSHWSAQQLGWLH